MEGINKTSDKTLDDLVGHFPDSFLYIYSRLCQFNYYDVKAIGSHPGVRSDLFNRPLNETRITDFFGGVTHVEMSDDHTHSRRPVTEDMQPEAEILAHPQPTIPSAMHTTTEKVAGWYHATKSLRAWGSIGLLGFLVLLVGGRS